MVNDMELFGTPKKLLDDKIKELEAELKKEKDNHKYYARLYDATNYMMCKLGADGEINALDSTVENVMEVLFDIDKGKFNAMGALINADKQENN